MFSLSLQTLGCKLNQLESEAIAGAFKKEGWRVLPEGEGADLFVINTCTVTSKAEQKARRIIRKILRENPRSCLIVTGCYAQVEAEALAALPGDALAAPPGASKGTAAGEDRRFFVIPGDRKSALLDLPPFLADRDGPGDLAGGIRTWAEARRGPLYRESRPEAGEPPPGGDCFRFIPEDFSFHTRAFLKIQDGCDNACSFCRVSLARGPSVSLAAETVLSRLRALESRGFAEAVLTGVNIAQYRDDCRNGCCPGRRDLGGLVEYLLGETETIALRLSSLEPGDSGLLFPEIFAHPRVRPHFHLSVQSGSPEILKKMGRRYAPEDVADWVTRLRDLKGDPFLACDIITGFPGETPGEFEETRALCRRLDFAWIHAFPYSRRPGTAACSFPNLPEPGAAVSRVAVLTRLAREGRAAYIRRWEGKTVEAVVEAGGESGRGYAAAVSANYLRLLLPCPAGEDPPPPGRVVWCRIGPPPAPERDHPPAARFDALAYPVPAGSR